MLNLLFILILFSARLNYPHKSIIRAEVYASCLFKAVERKTSWLKFWIFTKTLAKYQDGVIEHTKSKQTMDDSIENWAVKAKKPKWC